MHRIAMFLLVALLVSSVPAAAQYTIQYAGRYNCQSDGPDHLMDAIAVSGNRALIGGNLGVVLVDLASLPVGGTQNTLDRDMSLNVRNFYRKDNQYVYANLNRNGSGGSGGFAVIRLDGNSIVDLGTFDEPDVLYEKMCIDGDWLYVAAHSYGIRVYSLADPENPSLFGGLGEGFVDAWAIAVDGDTAYVADGGGGLKIVDITDRANPAIVAGENPTSALGTSEDVTVRDGNVYVAAGGEGIAVYEAGDLASRAVTPVGACAKDLDWIESYLVAATMDGVWMLDVTSTAPYVSVVAHEITARRGANARLRICSAVGVTPDYRLLCADWNTMDMYQVVPTGSGNQADINTSDQRLRFPPDGGSMEVTVSNNGIAPLDITSVSSTAPSFTADFAGGVLSAGEEVTFLVHYDGSAQGSAVLRFACNDPDENPLPIQLFGRTDYLDPGEPAVDFTLPAITRDHDTGMFQEEPFTLSDHLGKLVWFQIYGSW